MKLPAQLTSRTARRACSWSLAALLVLAWLSASFEVKAQSLPPPVFASELVFSDATYVYTSSSTNSGGTRRSDSYTWTWLDENDDTQTRTIQVVSNPAFPELGVVSGEMPDGSPFEGRMEGAGNAAQFHDRESSSSGQNLTLHDTLYQCQETTITEVSLDTGSTTSVVSARTYEGNGSVFTISYDPSGTPLAVAGLQPEEYFLEGGVLYLDGEKLDVPAVNAPTMQLASSSFRKQAVMKEYERDGNGTLVSWDSREYWVAVDDPNHVLTLSRDAPDSVFVNFSTSGGLSGVMDTSGNTYFNSRSLQEIPPAQRTQVTYYGVVFTKMEVETTSGHGTSSEGAGHTTSTSLSYRYTGADSAYLIQKQDSDSDSANPENDSSSSWLEGWTRDVGAFRQGYRDAEGNWSDGWQPRDASLYAPRVLQVDGELFVWLEAVQDGNHIRDTYQNADGSRSLYIGGSHSSWTTGPNPRQHFTGGDPVAAWLDTEQGLCSRNASGASQGGMLVIGSSLIVPGETIDTTPWFLPEAASIWVNGEEHVFEVSHHDEEGHHADVYRGGNGAVVLHGTTPGHATVACHGCWYPAGLSAGLFTMNSPKVSIIPPDAFPEALWVDGYPFNRYRESDLRSTYNSRSGPSASMILTYVSPQVFDVQVYHLVQRSDNPDTEEVNESLDENGQPAFNNVPWDSNQIDLSERLVTVAKPDGGTHLVAALQKPTDYEFVLVRPPPSANGLPPGLRHLSGGSQPRSISWTFIGQNNGHACYATELGEGQGQGALLRIELPTLNADGSMPDQTVAMHILVGGSGMGVYHAGTRLFQSGRGLLALSVQTDPNLAESAIPILPLFAVKSDEDDLLWQPALPPQGVPSSFRLADGSLWRFSHVVSSGEDAGKLVYLGHHDGQQLMLSPAGADGYRLARLSDSETGLDTQGTFSTERQSILMRNGMVVYVGAADEWGQAATSQVTANQLSTINADLDVTGNMFSLGSLLGDSSRAGAVFQFEDGRAGGLAALHNVLTRSQAEWFWWRAGTASDGSALPAMQLDNENRLILNFRSSTTPGIILDPANPSSFKSGIRVYPAGDLPMDFTNGPMP